MVNSPNRVGSLARGTFSNCMNGGLLGLGLLLGLPLFLLGFLGRFLLPLLALLFALGRLELAPQHFEDGHLSAVAVAEPYLDDAGVAAVALREAWCESLEELGHDRGVFDEGERLPARVDGFTLAESDHLLA